MKDREAVADTAMVLEPPEVDAAAFEELDVVIDLRQVVVPTPYGARLDDLELVQRTW